MRVRKFKWDGVLNRKGRRGEPGLWIAVRGFIFCELCLELDPK